VANTKDIMTRLSLDVDRALLDVLKPYALDGQQKDLIRAALYAYMGLDFPPDLIAAGFTSTTIPASKQGQGSDGSAEILAGAIDRQTQAIISAILTGPPSPNSPNRRGTGWML